MYLQRRPTTQAAEDFMQEVNPLLGVPAPVHYAQRIGCCAPQRPQQLGGVFDALSTLGFIQEFLRS